MGRKLTTDEFVKRSKSNHINPNGSPKYDYSLVNYINSKQKVIIMCPIHGEFNQTPNRHLHGQGCPECGKITKSFKNTKTLDIFISEAIIKHGSKYDYSLVNYITGRIKVKIICPIHGLFEQLPNDHLQGHGCRRCGIEQTNRWNSISGDDFIKRSIDVHGTKYDYSRVEYINNRTKVCIICPEHGEFWQKPQSHTNGHGCDKCYYDKVGDRTRLTTDEFIERSITIFGDKYDYTNVEYINALTNVCIICPIHGEFQKKPGNHICQCQGCPKCVNDFSDSNYIHYMYQINNTMNGMTYIGIHSTLDECDGYMGSGVLLRKDQYSFGIWCFDKNILEYFNTREELLERERVMVDDSFINRVDTYNIKLGGC